MLFKVSYFVIKLNANFSLERANGCPEDSIVNLWRSRH